jgi:hypothetical protein
MVQAVRVLECGAQNLAQSSVLIFEHRKAALASVRMAQNVDQTMPKHA